MDKKEQAKSDIETLRSILAIVLTALFAVFGYGIVNVESLSKKQIYLGFGAALFLGIVFIALIKMYLNTRKKL